jgi:polyhydroxyalkanoate synthesis regulator protein
MKFKVGGPRKISTSGTRSQLEEKPRKKKKRVDVEADVDTKPKKKKKDTGELTGKQSSELSLVGGSSLVMDKKSKRILGSYFNEHSSKIIDMLEAGDNDGGITLLKKKLLQTVIRTLPAAEKVLVESESSKGTYQFVTLISQIRELMADIQADRDRAYIAQSLLETIIRPRFMDIAQNMMTKHHDFRKGSEEYVKPQHAQAYSTELLKLAKDLAKDMMTSYKELEGQLIEALKT